MNRPVIDGKEVHSFEIVQYYTQHVDDGVKIVIKMIKALDENGVYIRFVGLQGVIDYLPHLPVTFKVLKK
jgi:GH35 family endo-1,4-beta-xylanase